MNKWMTVTALGMAMLACGCNCNKNKDKDMNSSEPKKMSTDASKQCAEGQCIKADAKAK